MDIEKNTLYDHYKETVCFLKSDNKLRDRLFLYSLIIEIMVLFQIFSNDYFSSLTNDIAKEKLGIKLTLDSTILSNVLMLLLFVFLVRYYQICVSIERTYAYIHHIEEKLNNLFSPDFITREGKSYLKEYPMYSNVVDIFYKIIYPGLIIFTCYLRFRYGNFNLKMNLGNWVLFTFICLNAIIVILYLSSSVRILIEDYKGYRAYTNIFDDIMAELNDKKTFYSNSVTMPTNKLKKYEQFLKFLKG